MATRDFQHLLDRQLKFMENSCLLYDSEPLKKLPINSKGIDIL